MVLQADLKLLIGKQVKAVGSCGIGKGQEITGTLHTDGSGYYEVHVTKENVHTMPYSVYTQTIEEIKVMTMKDWNEIMKDVALINATHNQGINARDYAYTIQYLLNGGFFGKCTTKLPRLTMTLENLNIRICEYLQAIKEVN